MPIAAVERRDDDRPNWLSLVTSFKNPLGSIVLYSVLLTGVNRSLGPESVLNTLFFLISLASLAATFLLSFVSPGFYLLIAAHVFAERFTGLVRNWILTCILVFGAFIYGCLLSVFGSYLDPPEHQLSTSGLVMVTFVLALPPAFHALQSVYVSE
ncbi:hypothetical protein M407DRAFT_223366 [Tulasnella calospora MUT 4182]|uniref:Uncharacterized protein n=1 Tax=Tulasnella calospora MUT 4182 TaxID=1051891 RepID=A0A0C3QRX5_9AGAM|nr:hypothetical protein M407DRAFT_223366 [Tulasnella calospora MUT 4182]